MLKCIPISVPRQIHVNQQVQIVFGVQNLYNVTISAFVFVAYCNNDPNCNSFNIIWHSQVFQLLPGQTRKLELLGTFKKAGYFGIGVYNLTMRRGECGFIVQATSAPPSGGGGIPNPFSAISNIFGLIQMLIVVPLILAMVNLISGAIESAVKGR